jgi:hypothetical protein
MKQVFTFLSFIFYTYALQAQEIDITTISPEVADQFALLYPDAKSITWQLINDQYLATFKNDKMVTSALLAADGSLLKTETEIKVTALPLPAYAYLEALLEPKNIEMATIIQDQEGIITFEAMADKLEYTFDAEGNMLGITAAVVTAR